MKHKCVICGREYNSCCNIPSFRNNNKLRNVTCSEECEALFLQAIRGENKAVENVENNVQETDEILENDESDMPLSETEGEDNAEPFMLGEVEEEDSF